VAFLLENSTVIDNLYRVREPRKRIRLAAIEAKSPVCCYATGFKAFLGQFTAAQASLEKIKQTQLRHT